MVGLTSLKILVMDMASWTLGRKPGSGSSIGLVRTIVRLSRTFGRLMVFLLLWPSGLLLLLVWILLPELGTWYNKLFMSLQHLAEEHMQEDHLDKHLQEDNKNLQDTRTGPWLPWDGPSNLQDLVEVVALELLAVLLQVRMQVLVAMCPPSTSSLPWGD